MFIGGRWFSAHQLGIYTTALFLAQIFVSKFVPPLNEVAFSAYARIQHDDAAVSRAFVRSVRIIMLAAMPFYAGLAVTAYPLVLTVLDAKWVEVAPVVQIIALAMPFMTIQVLYSPACDARGRPGIGARNGAFGALVLATTFLVGCIGAGRARVELGGGLSRVSGGEQLAVAAGDRRRTAGAGPGGRAGGGRRRGDGGRRPTGGGAAATARAAGAAGDPRRRGAATYGAGSRCSRAARCAS